MRRRRSLPIYKLKDGDGYGGGSGWVRVGVTRMCSSSSSSSFCSCLSALVPGCVFPPGRCSRTCMSGAADKLCRKHASVTLAANWVKVTEFEAGPVRAALRRGM